MRRLVGATQHGGNCSCASFVSYTWGDMDTWCKPLQHCLVTGQMNCEL